MDWILFITVCGTLLLIELAYITYLKHLPNRRERQQFTYVTATYVSTKIIHMRGDSASDTFSYGLALYVYKYKGITHKVYAKNDVRGYGKTFQQNYPYCFDSDSFPDKLELKIDARTGKILK